MKHSLVLVLVFVGFFSCKKETVIANPIITTNKVIKIKKSKPKKTAKKKQIIKKEKIILDTFIYPKFKVHSKFKVFGTGTFYEKPAKTKINNWYGIFYFKKLNKYYISKTKLKTKKIEYAFSVETTNKDKCILLMSGFFLPEIEIIEEKTVPHLIFPGDTINFKFLNKDYTLHVTGIKRKMEGFSDKYYSYNYKLYLTSMKNNKKVTTLLVSVPSPDPFIPITFMGDIDGDKKLDLIINASNHYSLTRQVLFLSKPANQNEM